MTKTSPTSRRGSANGRPATEADRRFALLVALMTPHNRLEKHHSAEGDRREGDNRPPAYDEPRSEEDRKGGACLNRRDWNVLLFAGCAVAAVLFILAAAFIKP